MKITDFNLESKPVRMLLTVAVGIIGGLLFMTARIPLPWMLGPMTALLIGSKLGKLSLYWPVEIRNWGLIIIGYSSGLSFNRETMLQITGQLTWMLVMTFVLIAFTAVTALLVSKLSGIDYPSVLTGGIPGGLTQMVVLGEEMEGMDLTVITFFQVVRLMLIVFCVPLLVFSPLYAAAAPVRAAAQGGAQAALQNAAVTAAQQPLLPPVPGIVIFAAISILCALAAKKLKFPTPYLLGPILGIAVLNISGLHGPAVSPLLLIAAQFSMGCYLGLLLKPEKLDNKVKMIALSILNSLILIIFSLGLSYILVKVHGVGPASAFLCMAPGGADQMGVIASAASADVSMVMSYQLFRMLLVNFAIPPVLKWFYAYYRRTRPADAVHSPGAARGSEGMDA